MKFARPEPGQPTLVSIGEQMLEIRYPLGVIKELEREHKIAILKGATFGEVIQSPEKLAILLYSGLKTKQPAITQDWVDQNVDAVMLRSLSPYIFYAMSGVWSEEALKKLYPEEYEGDSPNSKSPSSAGTLPANGSMPSATGSPFGRSDDTTSVLTTAKSSE